MADISITAASVLWSSGVRPITGKAGATITAGQTVYLDTTTNTYKLADGDTDLESVVAGVCLDGGVSGRDIFVAPPLSLIHI